MAIPCGRPGFVFCAVVSATAALAGHCKLCLYARCSERDGRPAHIIDSPGRRLGSSRGFGDGFERHAIALPRRQRLRGRLLEMCRRLHETSSGPRLLGAGPGEPGRRPRCPGSGARVWSPGPGPLGPGPGRGPRPGDHFLTHFQPYDPQASRTSWLYRRSLFSAWIVMRHTVLIQAVDSGRGSGN